MSSNKSTLKNKVSPHIQNQLPEFVQSDHPLFGLFLKYYYQFLEAGELVLTGSNNYLIEETITKNYILDQTGENIVLEDSVGKFTVGEIITGATSGATATILVDDFDDNNRLFVTSQQQFITGETITGATSGASSTVSSYRGNPIQNIQQLLAYADVDNTVYSFLDQFRDSFMESIPNTLADGISKRKLIKSIKDMYAAKGTRDGHKMFFRILLDEEAQITYPRDNILRPSDGQWSTDSVLRIVETSVTSDFNKAIGQVVTGNTSGATAVIVTVIKFREGADVVTELNLDSGSVSGTFTTGEVVTSTDTTLDLEITGTVKSILTGVSVTTGGAYYNTSDVVTIGTGGNNAATAVIASAGSGSIDEIMIEDGGSGYSLGEVLVFDNSNTNGTDVQARISVVGGGLLIEPHTAPDHMTTEDGDFIVTDDDIQYIQHEQTVGELDHLVFEDGGQIIIEEETFNDLGVSSEIGEITKVSVINKGNGYTKLPLVSDSAITTGSGASLFASSTVAPMVGHVEGVSVTNFGLNYLSSPDIQFNQNVLVKNVSGTWTTGDTLTTHDGSVVDFDSNRNILEVSTTATLNNGDTITSISGATATIHQASTASATSVVGTVGTTVGNFISDRGKVSVDTMKIQDSFYYQDYSYVVKIGESINLWRDSIRRSVHPAGWNVFGEVTFASQVSATIQTPAAGSVSGFTGDTETFTPELASTFRNIFHNIFGRRLGTDTDGTTQRVSAKVDVASPSELTSGTRDVTLVSEVTVRTGVANVTARVLGPTLDLLPKYAFSVPQTDTSVAIPHYPGITRVAENTHDNRAYFNIGQFAHVRIEQVSDGSGNIPASAYTTKLNVPPPGEIKITSSGAINAFDNTFVTFDQTDNTFDEEGTPRAYSGMIYASYDETGGITFDETGSTFDVGT